MGDGPSFVGGVSLFETLFRIRPRKPKRLETKKKQQEAEANELLVLGDQSRNAY